MEFHEIANIFPMMTGNDSKELKEDIAENGLREPIYIYGEKYLTGATGIAALKNGCLFDGIDIDIKSVNITKGRLDEATKTL